MGRHGDTSGGGNRTFQSLMVSRVRLDVPGVISGF